MIREDYVPMDQRTNGQNNPKARNHADKGKKLLLSVTAFALVATPLISFTGEHKASAATAATSQISTISKFVKPIMLSGSSYINLVDASLVPSDNGQIAAFTLSIYNGGASELNLMDYWFRLKNSVGGTYSIKTAAADAKVTKVASKTKTFITLYAQVGEYIKLSDLSLNIVKFDFSAANYERSLGKFTFPTAFTNVTAAGAIKPIYFSNTTLYSKIASATVGSSGDDTFVTVNFVYNNMGKKSVTLSKYKYYIVAAGGEMYEATPEDTADLVMDPLKRKEFKLTATIPSTVKTTGAKLVIVKSNGEDATINLPVGSYQIQFGGPTTSTATDTFNYATSNGTYQFNLAQLTRQPWGTQDVLSARVRITNKSTTSIAIPNITGYFYLDDKVKLDFKTVATDNTFGLNAGAYVDLDVYAKLPTNYSFTKAKLIINDQKDDKTSTKAGELLGTSSQTAIPVYAVDRNYQIARVGSKSTATIKTVNIYNSTTSKVFDVQVTLTNNELRTITPSNLVGYFVNENGDTFPATTNAGEGNINPNNKSLISFTTVLPQNYSTSNLRLIIGEGITDTKYSTGTAVPDAYLNTVKFNLPVEQRTLSRLKDVPMLNYKLTINKFTPNVLAPTMNLDLNYTLDKDMTVNAVPKDHKLVLALEGFDPDEGKTYTYYSEDLDIDGDKDKSLKPGTNNKVTLTKDLNYDTFYGDYVYYARIYEVTQNSKKLVAEQEFRWFFENDWTKENSTASSN